MLKNLLNELDYMREITGRVDIPPPPKLIDVPTKEGIEMIWVFWEWEVPDCPPDDTWPGLFLNMELRLRDDGSLTFVMRDYCNGEHALGVDLDLWVSRFLRIQRDGWWLETNYGSETRAVRDNPDDVAQRVRDILGLP